MAKEKAKQQLHQILAVDGDAQKVAENVIGETITTFTKKPAHFAGGVKNTVMFDDDKQNENTVEHSALTETVPHKLEYLGKQVARHYDIHATKERTNQEANADLVVDGLTIATDVPATVLLGLESRLKTLRKAYEAIPTLAPGVAWVLDESLGKDIYKTAHPEERFKTAKAFKSETIAPATKEHPAQVETWWLDENVGKITIEQQSGLITPAHKSELLGRVDKLIRAVKQARQRANSTDVVEMKLGAKMFSYINNGTV